jgi:uncharacterized membrane protein
MEAYILEWTTILLRWLHMITAIAWIGASFYFVWLDNNLAIPSDPALLEKGVGGELWAVHGGGFYNPQKYLLAPKTLPQHLHWFFWESYSTWLSGFALFAVLYLLNANTFLIDAHVMPMTATVAVLAALAFLVFGWIVYDVVCRLVGGRPGADRIVGGLITLYVIAAVWLLCHVFAGRAAFLLSGAMLATIMSANVLFVIIPGQRKVIAAMRAGETPDPIHGKRGKQRSVHNTYFTLPVIFAMLSNHYSMLYSAANNWLVLLLMMLAGVVIRQFFLLRHKGIVNWWLPAGAVCMLLAVIVWLAPQPAPALTSTQDLAAGAVSASAAAESLRGHSFDRVRQIIAARCLQCHAAHPTLMPTPGKNVVLDTDQQIIDHAQMIYQQAVMQKTMPLGNMTNITDEERAVIGAWFTAGASAK